MRRKIAELKGAEKEAAQKSRKAEREARVRRAVKKALQRTKHIGDYLSKKRRLEKMGKTKKFRPVEKE